jgi:hypothetical protein
LSRKIIPPFPDLAIIMYPETLEINLMAGKLALPVEINSLFKMYPGLVSMTLGTKALAPKSLWESNPQATQKIKTFLVLETTMLMIKPFQKHLRVLQWEQNMEALKSKIYSLDLGPITSITTPNQA